MRKRVFGRKDGRSVDEIVLESADAAVAILNYGCVLRDWRVDVRGRSPADGARVSPLRGLRAALALARRDRRADRQPDGRREIRPGRKDLRADPQPRAGAGAPHPRRGGRARPGGLGDGGRGGGGGGASALSQPRRRGGLSGHRRVRGELSAGGADGSSARCAGGRTGRRRSTWRTTPTSTSGAGGRSRTTCCGWTRRTYTPLDAGVDPDRGRSRRSRARELDFREPREIGETLYRQQLRAAGGPGPGAAGGLGALPADRAAAARSGPGSRGCRSSTRRR